MRKLGWWTAIVVLVVLNGIMLWRVQTLDQALRAVTGDEAYLTILDGRLTDGRGIYTYPTFGQYLMPLCRFRPIRTRGVES